MHTSAITSTPRHRRIAGLAIAAAAAAALAPQAASAAVVSQSDAIATYQAASGEVNKPIPFIENGRLKVRESNTATTLVAGPGCVIVSERLADCGNAGTIRVRLGDRDDTFFGTGAGAIHSIVNGDAGNDVFMDGNGALARESYIGGEGTDTANYSLERTPVVLSIDAGLNDGEAGEGDFIAPDVENLVGGAGSDNLTGDDDANVLTGGLGNDQLTGRGGNDTFEEGSVASGQDLINGGSGIDRARYASRVDAGVKVSLDRSANDGAPNEFDNVLDNVENVTGSQLADTLLGSDFANTLSGLGGNDTINPRGGSDVVFAGAGDDTINVKDGVRDSAQGNSGTDHITFDSGTDDVTA